MSLSKVAVSSVLLLSVPNFQVTERKSRSHFNFRLKVKYIIFYLLLIVLNRMAQKFHMCKLSLSKKSSGLLSLDEKTDAEKLAQCHLSKIAICMKTWSKIKKYMALKPKKLIQRSESLQYSMSAFLKATDTCNTIINRKKDVKILNQCI